MRTFVVPEGMPRSIFENKYSRQKVDGTFQSWAERVSEVVAGNFTLAPEASPEDYQRTLELATAGVMPFSGRHLQHGDLDQKNKIGESYVNCATALFSFVNFWLLLKGSGVGRCYDSALCRTDWDNLPNVRFVLDAPDIRTGVGGHPDYETWIESVEEARHKYDSESEMVRWFEVADSAEGWVKVIEVMETAAWQGKHRDKLYIFDFSRVRGRGVPIVGQQGRPASGPIPFIKALIQVCSIRGAGMKPWKQAMYVDHYLADCVAMGGIRRSSRIAVKSWRDRDVIEFIDIKRGGWLHTANNSVGLDDEFWEKVQTPAPSHARRVFEAMCSAGYFDNTGEPGFLNLQRMVWNSRGLDRIQPENLLCDDGSRILDLHPKTLEMMGSLLQHAKSRKFPYLCNPCGEVVLAIWGGYCVIGDICLANAESLEEVLDAARLMAPFLMRTNLMKFLYKAEVKRTNRIGIGITGIHEFAYKHFGLSFWDLIDEERSQTFWDFMASMRHAAEQSATQYAEHLGVEVPHTMLTIKPSGTISKVCACTEGAHLPAYAYYVRWVQYNQDASEVPAHRHRGYPIKDISQQYPGRVVVGFPTKLPIADVMGADVVCAGDPSPEQHYQWLRLLEKYWLGEGTHNQVSYSLKYDPTKLRYEDYMRAILKNQSTVRACSFMPQSDLSAYAYLPEEVISKETYDGMLQNIRRFAAEAYDDVHLACSSGACPLEPDHFTPSTSV